MSFHSAIYRGEVRHRRHAPVRHEFAYRLFMMYLDLDELPRVLAASPLWSRSPWAPARFRRADYLSDPRQPLQASVRAEVARALGRNPTGPIRMLTHLRYWGYCFNPVTFYYCLSPADDQVDAIVAEITNTPWNERHRYVLDAARGTAGDGTGTQSREAQVAQTLHWTFPKSFHVSPFMEMGLDYAWSFTTPGPRLGVHMENLRAGTPVFDATLTLTRHEITPRALSLVLLQYPFMTLKVIAAIHGQAARLYLKRAPFHPHPRKRQAPNDHPGGSS